MKRYLLILVLIASAFVPAAANMGCLGKFSSGWRGPNCSATEANCATDTKDFTEGRWLEIGRDCHH
jgi:hypothetical protein